MRVRRCPSLPGSGGSRSASIASPASSSDRDGIRFTFASRRYPLEAYSRALEDAGLAIEGLREPPLPGSGGHRRTRIPLFLLWRATKREGRA